MKKTLSYYFNDTIWPGFFIAITFALLIFGAEIYQEILAESQYITPAAGPALVFGSGPYLLFALLGFGLFHTKNGKKIPTHYNITALIFTIVWVASTAFYWPGTQWTAATLDSVLSFVTIINGLLVTIPFVIFYTTIPKTVRFDEVAITTRSND